LIVRTGGNVRHSGFLLYDCDYSEYYFSEKYWPEFDEKELDKAIHFFESSKRNFGK
jgi:undecaprenyl diphosphate synthase